MNLEEIGVSTSACGYTMGVTGNKTDRKNPNPWTLFDFVDAGIRFGVGGIEAPIMRFIPDLNEGTLSTLEEKLTTHSLFCIVDADAALDSEQIQKLIPIAQRFNSSIIRIKSSNILGFSRALLGVAWEEHVARCIQVLSELAPSLRAAHIRIAIENHQDLDTNDLLRITEEVGADVVGVNFDIGNAFASCEDPFIFLQKLAPYILNIHLKDYKIYETETGFKLVRCILGDGAVDFKNLIPLLRTQCPEARMVIELGAQEARSIDWKTEDFWNHVSPRKQDELVQFFKTLTSKSLTIEDDSWKTFWEKGALYETILSSEYTELEKSIQFMQTV